MAERFFGSLKREWTSYRDYETRQESPDDIIEYIEIFYNSNRKHSYLGYLSPNEYEEFDRVAYKKCPFGLDHHMCPCATGYQKELMSCV